LLIVQNGDDKVYIDMNLTWLPNTVQLNNTNLLLWKIEDIYYVLNTNYYTWSCAWINKYLRGSTDPPADRLGVYPNHSSSTALYSQSVIKHETWGTGANPPAGLNPNADGHHKLFWNYISHHDIREAIEQMLGFGTQEDFKNAVSKKASDIYDVALDAANATHTNWTDPLPDGVYIDFWDETVEWIQVQSPIGSY